MASSSIRRHNETVLQQLEPGDIVEFPREGLYSHYAVYAGHGKVIHLWGENDGIGDASRSGSIFSIAGEEFDKACVRQDDFHKVAMHSKAKKNNKEDKGLCPIGRGMDIVRRAREKLGETGYNVLRKNCEHFATWCRYGMSWSEQVDTAEKLIACVGLGVIGVAGAIAGIAIGQHVQRQRRNANN